MAENAQRTPKPLRGVPIGLPHVSGMQVAVKHGELLEFTIGDEPLQPDRIYRVAGTDLEFSELVGYLVVPDELITYEVPTIVPEMLADYLTRHTPIGPLDQRFFFVDD